MTKNQRMRLFRKLLSNRALGEGSAGGAWRGGRDSNPQPDGPGSEQRRAVKCESGDHETWCVLGAVARRDASGCWLWLGPRDGDGYGRFWINGRKTSAHRLAWTLAHGEIADGLHVLHRCDRPACVNPDHLALGTHWQNMADRDAKGRTVVPMRSGGAWTGKLRRVG